MQKKKLFFAFCIGVVSLVACTGVAYAATRDIVARLGGKPGDTFKIVGTILANTLKITKTVQIQGAISNPAGDLRLADNVRVDGQVYRGTKAGTGDSQPVIVSDNLRVTGAVSAGSVSTGTLTATGLSGSGIVMSDNLASGAVTQGIEAATHSITTTKSGTDYDTAAEVQLTTGSSSLFCMFSGYGSVSEAHRTITIGLIYDGEILERTVRGATGSEGAGLVTLTTSALLPASAGTHTVRLGWNTSAGTTATMFFNTLDCIELKK